jgi:hypothetical protein
VQYISSVRGEIDIYLIIVRSGIAPLFAAAAPYFFEIFSYINPLFTIKR